MTRIFHPLHSYCCNNHLRMDKYKKEISGGKTPPIAILGVPFDNITIAETLAIIEQMILSRRPHYLATANVDFLVQARQDVELRRILFDAHLVICDGTPLVWASRLLGNPLPERVAGSDVVPLLLKLAAEKGYRPFFLGATPDSIETAVRKVKEQFPTLQIAGFYSPPFNKLLEMDHDRIRDQITESKPDLLLVGFGCPKQEKWINMHYRSLGVPVSIGVGGTIDFLAGKLSRAPVWMQRSGTEWIYRMLQEPRRLASRYAKDLWYFGGGIAAQIWRLQLRKWCSRRQPGTAPLKTHAEFNSAVLPERLDCEEVLKSRDAFESLASQNKPCVLDANAVQFIDSTGIGMLIRLHKQARTQPGGQMLLANLSPQMRRALQLMRLEEFFIITDDLASAQDMIQRTGQFAAVRLKSLPAVSMPALAWDGELTAANAEEVWAGTLDHISARSLVQHTLTIDLSHLQFIDSTGLGIMVRAKKFGARQGVTICFTEPRPNVLNVIRLSRLDEYLLKPSP
jgi:N-acetylglucosaminyldiphosphoundecaprenol N-acetyl-beta-D-mannosaminyltransferase